MMNGFIRRNLDVSEICIIQENAGGIWMIVEYAFHESQVKKGDIFDCFLSSSPHKAYISKQSDGNI